jgi:hypothetical protein
MALWGAAAREICGGLGWLGGCGTDGWDGARQGRKENSTSCVRACVLGRARIHGRCARMVPIGVGSFLAL